MKVLYKSSSGRFTIEVEGTLETELYRQMADFENSVFEGDIVCGMTECGGKTRFNVREHDGNDYFEKKCLKCGATLPLHQSKKNKGKLYRKWDDQWKRWANKAKEEENDNEVFTEQPAATKKGGK